MFSNLVFTFVSCNIVAMVVYFKSFRGLGPVTDIAEMIRVVRLKLILKYIYIYK